MTFKYAYLYAVQYYTYILLCADESYYIGVTNDLARRLDEHQTGYYPRCYTYKRRPLELVYYETYQWIQDAIAREKQLKRWSHKKKEALIAGDETLLHALAEDHYSKRKRGEL